MATLALYQTTIGKKVIMAVTGLIWVGYVIGHMLGNLKVFAGPETINAYGTFLRTFGEPLFGYSQVLWLVRAVLAVSLVLHIWAAFSLTQTDLASRPVGYAVRKNVAKGYAARVMRWGGVIIAAFVVFHLLHLTIGTVHPSFVEGDIYHNMVAGFRVLPVSLFYIVAMVALGFHLQHGVWSMFQTLGLNNRGWTRFWGAVANVIAVVVPLGFISIPLAVLTGIVK